MVTRIGPKKARGRHESAEATRFMLQKGQRYGRSKTKNKEKKEVNNNRSKKFHGGVAASHSFAGHWRYSLF